MTDGERQAFSRLFDLAGQTERIEEEFGYKVVLSACRNFLGYLENSIHDGSFATIADVFVRNTSEELDDLVRASPDHRGFADEYRSVQARCVAAYRRVSG